MDLPPIPPCAQCQKPVATVHITTTVQGREQETLHLCEPCAAALQLLGQSLVDKSCSFCGLPATFSVSDVGEPINCCASCSQKYDRIFAELCETARPGFKQRNLREPPSFSAFVTDPELPALIEDVHNKTVRKMKDDRP